MPIIEDPVAWPLAERIRDCLCEMLEDSLPVKCCCIWYGDSVPWDDCSAEGDREGMAWVRIETDYATDNFPNPIVRPSPCGGMDGWTVQLELGVMRCAPTVNANGLLPDCEANTGAAWKAAHDKHLMRRVLMCCDWRDNDQQFVIGQWRPQGGEGGCQGGVLPVTVHVPEACICGEHGGE